MTNSCPFTVIFANLCCNIHMYTNLYLYFFTTLLINALYAANAQPHFSTLLQPSSPLTSLRTVGPTRLLSKVSAKAMIQVLQMTLRGFTSSKVHIQCVRACQATRRWLRWQRLLVGKPWMSATLPTSVLTICPQITTSQKYLSTQ